MIPIALLLSEKREFLCHPPGGISPSNYGKQLFGLTLRNDFSTWAINFENRREGQLFRSNCAVITAKYSCFFDAAWDWKDYVDETFFGFAPEITHAAIRVSPR
jgi:hypothetical protein